MLLIEVKGRGMHIHVCVRCRSKGIMMAKWLGADV